MKRRDAIDYLHDKMGYSRRLSAKLTDIAILAKSNKSVGFALQAAIEKNVGVIEKAKRFGKKKHKEEPKRFISHPTHPDQGIGKVGPVEKVD